MKIQPNFLNNNYTVVESTPFDLRALRRALGKGLW